MENRQKFQVSIRNRVELTVIEEYLSLLFFISTEMYYFYSIVIQIQNWSEQSTPSLKY